MCTRFINFKGGKIIKKPIGEKMKFRAYFLVSTALGLIASQAYAQEIKKPSQLLNEFKEANKCDEKEICHPISYSVPSEFIIISSPRKSSKFATPYSVSKIDKKELNAAGIKKAPDLIQIVPSLQFPQSESALSVTARIRGIGTQGTNVGLEPSVGIMIDGIMRSRTAAGFGDLGELSSIEVARGPQSTFYGGNVSAGLIYVVTEKPSQEFALNSFLTLGNLNYENWGVSINGGLSENLAGRIFFTSAKRDGYMKVNEGLSNARNDNNINYYSSRGQLYYQAGATDFRLIADFTQKKEACCNAPVYVSDSRVPVNSSLIINRIFENGKYIGNQFDEYRAYADRPFDQFVLDKGISFEINHNANFVKIKSISSYRYFDFAYAQDGEWSGADILYRDLALKPGAKVKDFSQELRFSNKYQSKFSWDLGLLFSKQTINSHNVFQYGKDYETYIGGLLSGASAALIPVSQYNINLRNLISSATSGLFNANSLAMVEGGGWSDYFTQEAQNYSVFGRGNYNINENINIIFGLRYSRDIKDFKGKYITSGANGCKAIEQIYGFNPSALAPSNLAGVVGTVCVPWARSALDGISHVQKYDDDNFSGNISYTQKLGQNLRLYANYSRGVKAGGFNLDRVMVDNNGSIVSGSVGNQIIRAPDTSFKPEIVDAYEIGLKGRYLNGDLEFALAIFNQDFQNFQLNTYNGISQIVASVPSVLSKGVELDYNYFTPIKGLKLSGGLAFVDAKYGNDLGAPNDANSFLGKNLNLYLIRGQQLTASPKWTMANTIQYQKYFGELNSIFTINHRHTSSFNGGSNLDPRKTVAAMDLFNGNIELQPKNKNWSLSFWGKNIGDKHYPQIIFDGPLQGNSPLMSSNGSVRGITSQLDGFPVEPRTYGITIRFQR